MQSDETQGVSRRGLLRASAGAAAGAGAATAASGTAAAQQAEVMVGSDDAPLAFSPDPLEIEPGTTVTFTWGTDGHNIVVETQPDDAQWEGIEEVHDTGFEYEHTFDVEGEYHYFCEPHLSAGMEADIVVEEGITEDSGGGPPTVPATAMSLAIGTIAAMVSTLALAYFFLKYGGRDES